MILTRLSVIRPLPKQAKRVNESNPELHTSKKQKTEVSAAVLSAVEEVKRKAQATAQPRRDRPEALNSATGSTEFFTSYTEFRIFYCVDKLLQKNCYTS